MRKVCIIAKIVSNDSQVILIFMNSHTVQSHVRAKFTFKFYYDIEKNIIHV